MRLGGNVTLHKEQPEVAVPVNRHLSMPILHHPLHSLVLGYLPLKMPKGKQSLDHCVFCQRILKSLLRFYQVSYRMQHPGKTALKQKLIYSPTQRKRLTFLESNSVKKVIQEIKRSRSPRDLQLRRLLHLVLTIKNKVKKKTAQREFGFSWNFLTKSPGVTLERKKRKDAFDADKVRKVTDFYSRGDITRELPMARKSNSGKVMECTTSCAYKIFKEENPHIIISLSQFQKLRPANVKPMSHTKLLQCMCEYCVNVKFILEALRPKISTSGKKVAAIKDVYAASEITVCSTVGSFPKKECVDRVCNECGVNKVREHLHPLLEVQGKSEVQWKSWEMSLTEKGKRMILKIKSGTIGELVNILATKLEPFAKHLANAKWQAMQFSNLCKSIPDKWVVFCLDFAENYNCHYQDEAQSAHWSYNQATIHPVVAYFNCPEESCDEVVHESLMFVSDDRTHDQHAVHHFVEIATEYLRRQGISFTKQVHFSDGAGSQYKNKTSFNEASYGMEDLGCKVEKHFFGSRHGKGPCDGEIGVLKRLAASAVKGRQVIISNAHDLYKYGRDYLQSVPEKHVHSRRTFFFVRDGEIQRERQERNEGLKPVPQTRSLHCFVGVMPSIIMARERSCFCSKCIRGEYDNCINVLFAGPVGIFQLQTGKKINQSNLPSYCDVPSSRSKTPNCDLPVPDNSCCGFLSSMGEPLTFDLPSPVSDCITTIICEKPEVKDYAASTKDSDINPESTRASLESRAPGSNRVETDPEDRLQPGTFVAVKLFGKQSCSVFIGEDDSWEPRSSILCTIGYPELANKREQFRFSNEDVSKMNTAMKI
ncbi:uncharacterized protein [Apostichopus japonicus]|uniref:uncharacterized protein isoform X2 n=1 Tax=Stichopus japonicus TaxID=307972 RepID=UPI003AB70D93